MRKVTLLLVSAVLLAACGGQPGSDQSAPDQPAPTPAPTAPTEEESVVVPRPPESKSEGPRTLTGTLGGDAQLEGGCTWLEAQGQRWQVQYPRGYQISVAPVQLKGPDGWVAREGDTVTVTGRSRPDLLTTCQVGPVFSAEAVRPG
ncbi:MAG: hypothetical protein ACRDU8_03530 [Egibacteraceae bacterium]